MGWITSIKEKVLNGIEVTKEEAIALADWDLEELCEGAVICLHPLVLKSTKMLR